MDNNNPQQFPGGPFLRIDGGGHHGGPGGLGWVIFALQLLMLAALAVLLIRAFGGRRPRFAGPGGPVLRHRFGGGPPDPLTIARMRYARGELSREEFVQLTTDLGGEPASEATTEPT